MTCRVGNGRGWRQQHPRRRRLGWISGLGRSSGTFLTAATDFFISDTASPASCKMPFPFVTEVRVSFRRFVASSKKRKTGPGNGGLSGRSHNFQEAISSIFRVLDICATEAVRSLCSMSTRKQVLGTYDRMQTYVPAHFSCQALSSTCLISQHS